MRVVHGQDCDFEVVEDTQSLTEAVSYIHQYDTLAFDTETYTTLPGGVFTDPYSCAVRLLQVGFPDRNPIIIDTMKVSVTTPLLEGPTCMEVLSKKKLIAHNATFDYKQVKVSLNTTLSNIHCSKVAMQSLALASGYKSARTRGFSYSSLCRDVLGVRVDKALQASDWSTPTLSDAQLEYAALDVGAPRGRKNSSLLLQCYALLKRDSDRLGMGEIWDLRQALVPIVGDMELNGLSIDTELLQELQEAVKGQVTSSTLSLCRILDLEVYSDLVPNVDGTWDTITLPTPKSAKLLNYKAGLLKHINNALKEHGVTLSDLQEESLKPHSSIPLVGALLQYTMNHKLLGDVEKYQRVINPITNRVHFQTNVIGTSTGRMSGSSDESAADKLSIQQMSGKEVTLLSGKHTSLRGCVVARKGSVLIDLDFSGQELRIAAALSGDEVMLNTFMLERDNPYLIHPDTGEKYENPLTDLHLVAAMNMKPYAYLKDVPLYEVARLSKAKGPDGRSPRGNGKTFNFSVIYGAAASSVALDLGVSQKEAESFLKDYFNNFSGLKKWLDRQAKLATQLRWLQLPMGAQIFVNEANAKGSGDKGAISRRAGNAPIQGTGAIMMASAIKYQREVLGDRLRHLAFIYDGMLGEIPLPKGEEAMDGQGNWNPYILQTEREAVQCMLDAMGNTLSPYIGKPFPCKVDSKVSIHWSH